MRALPWAEDSHPVGVEGLSWKTSANFDPLLVGPLGQYLKIWAGSEGGEFFGFLQILPAKRYSEVTGDAGLL
jgi:hypothetical protein